MGQPPFLGPAIGNFYILNSKLALTWIYAEAEPLLPMYVRRKPLPVILLVLLCTTHVCLAQRDTLTAACYVQHFDNTNGLPQNTVMDVAPDPYGFVWLSTEDGLARFDGLHFMTFGMTNLPVNSNRFRIFYKNQLGGLSVFNEKNERVSIANGWARPDTTAKGHDSYIDWYAVKDPNDSGKTSIVGLPENIRKVGGAVRRLVLYFRRDSYYEVSSQSVRQYENGKRSYEIAFRPDKNWDFFLMRNQLFYLHDNGNFTVLSSHPLTALLKGDIRSNPAFPDGMRYKAVYWNVYSDNQAVLYLNKTFYLVKADSSGGLATTRICTGFDIASLDINVAWYNEQQGKLYLGSTTKGLFILSRQQFYTWKTAGDNNTYYGQTAYDKDRILTAQGNLVRTTGEASTLPAISRLMPSDWYSIFKDRLNNIWIKWGTQVHQFDSGASRLLHSWRLPVKVSMIYDDGDGKVWIGLKGTGIAVLDISRKDAQPELWLPATEDVTYFSRLGNIMYTATGAGFYRINTLTKKVDTIAAFRNMYVRSLYVSGPDDVWLTTYGKGIFRYYQGRVTALPLDDDKFLATSHCIIPDRKGYYWITTNNGLFQVREADLKAYTADTTNAVYYHYYDFKDGFLTNEFNGGCQPCAVRLENGSISLPSLNGLVFFNPDKITPLLPDNDLYVNKMVVDQKEIPLSDNLQLPNKPSQLSFMISSPYMGNRKNLHITYALVEGGVPSIWLPVPDDGVIFLPMLAHGDYTLVVRKQNGFGKDNYREQKITFSIAAAWYQTGWFKLLCIAVLMVSSFLLPRLRIRYIQKRNAQLEEAVSLKTKELQQRTDIQERIIRSVGHDIQTPLRYQQLLSRKLYEGLSAERITALTEIAKVMHDHTNRLSYMTDNLLKYLKIQVATEPLQKDSFLLAAMAHDVVMIFQDIAREKGTEIFNYVPAQLQWEGNMQLLSVVLHNLIDNAVKVTRHGSIIIGAQVHNNQTVILVKDTGPGMQPHLLLWLNETGGAIPSQSGMGLMIVKELVNLLELDLYVSSLPDEGCCFYIRTRTS